MYRQAEENDGEQENNEDVQFLLDNLDEVKEYSYSFHVANNIAPSNTKCPDFLAYTTSGECKLMLNGGLTLNLITDKGLLHGIHQVSKTMQVRCNAGVTSTNLMGWLGDYPEPVWYNPKGVANILLLFRIKIYYRI
jgi:hypothetical protein